MWKFRSLPTTTESVVPTIGPPQYTSTCSNNPWLFQARLQARTAMGFIKAPVNLEKMATRNTTNAASITTKTNDLLKSRLGTNMAKVTSSSTRNPLGMEVCRKESKVTFRKSLCS